MEFGTYSDKEMLNFEFKNYMKKVVREAEKQEGDLKKSVCLLLKTDDSFLFTGEQIAIAFEIISGLERKRDEDN